MKTWSRLVLILTLAAAALSAAVPARADTTSAPAAPRPVTVQRVRFLPGRTSTSFSASLAWDLPRGYQLGVSGGQYVRVSASGSPAAYMFDPAGFVLTPTIANKGEYEFPIPYTGDYTLVLHGSGRTWVTITIPPLVPSPSATHIRFAPGATSATRYGVLDDNGNDVYVLKALAGQRMTVKVRSAEANVLLSISGADGDVLKSSGAGSAEWSGRLRRTQDYYLSVSSADGSPAAYTLQVTILPLGY